MRNKKRSRPNAVPAWGLILAEFVPTASQTNIKNEAKQKAKQATCCSSLGTHLGGIRSNRLPKNIKKEAKQKAKQAKCCSSLGTHLGGIRSNRLPNKHKK